MDVLSGWLPQALSGLTTDDVVSIGAALLRSTDLPIGWKPTGPDDPVLVDLFESFLRKPS